MVSGAQSMTGNDHKRTRLARAAGIRLVILASMLLAAGLLSSPTASAQSSGRTPAVDGSQACGTTLGDGGIPATGSIGATRAEVLAIEETIAAEQLCITNLSEQYDQATYHLQQIDAPLTATKVRLAVAETRRRNPLAAPVCGARRLHVRRAGRRARIDVLRDERHRVSPERLHGRRSRKHLG